MSITWKFSGNSLSYQKFKKKEPVHKRVLIISHGGMFGTEKEQEVNI